MYLCPCDRQTPLQYSNASPHVPALLFLANLAVLGARSAAPCRGSRQHETHTSYSVQQLSASLHLQAADQMGSWDQRVGIRWAVGTRGMGREGWESVGRLGPEGWDQLGSWDQRVGNQLGSWDQRDPGCGSGTVLWLGRWDSELSCLHTRSVLNHGGGALNPQRLQVVNFHALHGSANSLHGDLIRCIGALTHCMGAQPCSHSLHGDLTRCMGPHSHAVMPHLMHGVPGSAAMQSRCMGAWPYPIYCMVRWRACNHLPHGSAYPLHVNFSPPEQHPDL